MAEKGERWPPVYDLDDLVAEIKRLTEHHDIATRSTNGVGIVPPLCPATSAKAT